MYKQFLVFTAALLMVVGTSLLTSCGGGETPSTEQSTEETTTEGESAKVIYVCPMHPEETSEDPEAKCGVCGMAMVKAEEAGTTETDNHEGHDHDNHEGHNH